MFDRSDLTDQRRRNRVLRFVPRLGVIGPVRRHAAQAALGLRALGADRRLRERGLQVENRVARIDGEDVRLRIIRPASPRGILIDIHGGAWAIGSAKMDDPLNAAIAGRCGLTAISIDYRLALPRTIPELQRECLAAMRWILTQPEFASGPVLVTGESAGAHLALSCLVRLKAEPPLLARVAGALLHYGAYDLGGSDSARGAGRDTLVLHGPTLERQIQHLLPGLTPEQRRAPALSPVFDDLSGLPPMLVMTGDIDPLRDDSYLLVRRLQEAGNRVTLEILPEAPHGIIHFGGRYAEKVRWRGQDWLISRMRDAARTTPPTANAESETFRAASAH